jgi:hypothetical protein
MSIKLTTLKRDIKRQNEGDWIPIPELTDAGTGEVPEFLVRGNNYGPYQLARQQVMQKFMRRGQVLPPPDVSHRDYGKCVAQHLLLDWRNVAEPFSRELAQELICDPASPMQDYVLRCSFEVAEVEQEFTKEASGN